MTPTFLKHFDPITDPRIERCKKHDLLDILLLAICAVISGAEGWENIEDFGHLKLDWLRRYAPFKAGIPKHDAIARVIWFCRKVLVKYKRAEFQARLCSERIKALPYWQRVISHNLPSLLSSSMFLALPL